MNELEHFKMLNDMWNSHFNIMLTCVSILAAIFGLVIPLAHAYWERKNFNDTIANYKNELQQQESKLQTLQNNFQNFITSLSNAQVALAQFYLDKATAGLKNYSALSQEEKVDFLVYQIECFGNVLKCLALSENKRPFLESFDSLMLFSELINTDEANTKKALESLFLKSPRCNFFLDEKALEDFIGINSEEYKRFKNHFSIILDFIRTHY